MSKFSEMVERIRAGDETVTSKEAYELCETEEQLEFMINEMTRENFILDVVASGEEAQTKADKEKDEINAENGYDKDGNVVVPIPQEWM